MGSADCGMHSLSNLQWETMCEVGFHGFANWLIVGCSSFDSNTHFFLMDLSGATATSNRIESSVEFALPTQAPSSTDEDENLPP